MQMDLEFFSVFVLYTRGHRNLFPSLKILHESFLLQNEINQGNVHFVSYHPSHTYALLVFANNKMLRFIV